MLAHFRNLAIPAALGMLFSTLYNVVDVFYAGLLSTEAQAGLAIGFQAFFVMIAAGFGLGSALSALVSNAKGARNADATRSFAVQGLGFATLMTFLLMVAGWFVGPYLIALVSEPGSYRDAAEGYLRFLIAALPGFVIAYGANGILQAHGDTRTMQRALMVAFLANIVLNPLFMFGIPGFVGGMGFNGIAIATVASQTGVMLFILSRVVRLPIMADIGKAAFIPDIGVFWAIFRQMLPASMALIVMLVSGFVVQYALKGFGGQAIAAYGVALRIEQILLLPVLGMTGALLPIVAQNFGAGNHARISEAVFLCWKLGFAVSLVTMPLLWFGGAYAMKIFTSDPEVVAIGASYLLVDGFLFPLYMMLFSINSFLQGVRKPGYIFWIGLYRQGFGVAFFVWVFIAALGFDVWGVWLGIAGAVLTGWALAIAVAHHVRRSVLRTGSAAPQA